MRAKLRVYLRVGERFAQVAWFGATPHGELLFGFPGLASSRPVCAGRFPDREVTTEELHRGIACDYSTLEHTSVVTDHFTFHRDGTCHLKRTPEAESLYSDEVFSPPIDRTTERFLDLMLLPDVSDRYVEAIRKRPYLSVAMEPARHAVLRAWASGTEFDLGKIVKSEAPRYDVVRGFRLGDFKVAIAAQGLDVPHDAAATRPSGTLVSFRWLVAPDQHLVRGFRFT